MHTLNPQVAAGVLLSLFAGCAAAQQTYRLTELSVTGEPGLPWAISAAGHVTGSHDAPDENHPQAFLWDGTTIRDLGTLGGDASGGSAVNRSGHVLLT